MGGFGDQIWLVCFGNFWKFLLICELYFWQISTLFDKFRPIDKFWQIHVSKDALNHFLVNSSVVNISNDIKHTVVFFFV